MVSLLVPATPRYVIRGCSSLVSGVCGNVIGGSFVGCTFLLGFALLAGCGDGKSSVSGTITFVKADGELAREGAVIADGKFQALLPSGKYKIELNAQKVIRKQKQKGFDGAEEEVELTDELFPPRYNAQTELTEDIPPGSHTLRLELPRAN